MSKDELIEILDRLRALESENEIVEFKHARDSYNIDKLGKYFSALSNEANIASVPQAWFVMGIHDKSHNILGTNFKNRGPALNALKKYIADMTNQRITFIDIHTLKANGKRVILFQIPAAAKGVPTTIGGHAYGRDHESLVPLSDEKRERMRTQERIEDWSAVIVKEATINDLDKKALTQAKANFISKYPDKKAEMKSWSEIAFLNKAKICRRGKVTRAALLLLGKEESAELLLPAVANIHWQLKDSKGTMKDYVHIGPPFLLGVDKVYARIRNSRYRYMKAGSLTPEEVDQYDPFVIREAINNCIAHQDYTKCGRINVIEEEDQLTFTNKGEFIPGTVERVIEENAPEEVYRNPFLAAAMVNLKMVDTAGSGIRRMFVEQGNRHFPLPEYDLTDQRVKVEIVGKVLDLNYANLLARNADLSLEEIIMLDKVQKKKSIAPNEAAQLKSKKLIEGRKPNYFISQELAAKTGTKADYSKNKGMGNQYYRDFIVKAITDNGSMTREDIDELLLSKLPDGLSPSQRKNKVSNLLNKLRHLGLIKNIGSYRYSSWMLCS